MFLKFVKQKKKTYVYIMEYLAVEERNDKNYQDRKVVKGLGDVSNAILQLEIWKRHPQEIPSNIINDINMEDLEKWLNLTLEQRHIYNIWS